MKKILLTTLYPFWFFLAKTFLGQGMMLPIALAPIPILIHLIFPDLMMTTGEEAEGIGMGIGMLSLVCSPFTGMMFMTISEKLEANYNIWNYKTEMETKFG